MEKGCMEDKSVSYFKFLLHYFMPYYRYCGVILVCLLLEVMIVSAFPFSFKYLVDYALLGQSLHLLILIITLLAIAGVSEVFIGIYEDYLFSWVVAKILQNIRENIFDHLNIVSMRFYAHKKIGDLVTHFAGDLLSIEQMIVNINSGLVTPVLFLIFNLILLSILSWQLFLIILVSSFLVSLGPLVFSKPLISNTLERKQMESNLLTFTHENIIMQMIIKAFGLLEYISNLYVDKNNKLTSQIHHTSFLSSLAVRSADLTTLLLKIILLIIGSFMVSKNILSVGSLMAFFLIYTNVLSYLVGLAEYSSMFMRDSAGINRIQSFLNEQPTIVNSTHPIIIKYEKEITFEQVYFRYKDRDLVLQDLSFSIPKGSRVAFVGASGSGKSTIMNCILRFCDPTSGRVKMDGTNLRDISLEYLHQLIGYVPQEQLLFRGSIRENILMGKLDASQYEIENAAKLAQIHDAIINLPQAYDTLLEEQGSNLSIGQKQRIAIARAIIRQPEILILDESASALDSTTEQEINQTIMQLGERCTTIAISHRLQSVKNFSHIFVVQKGRLIEQGTHEYLLSLNGVYANMWGHQTGFIFRDGYEDVKIPPERLQKIPIFNELSLEFLTKIASEFKTVNYPTGKTFITQGEVGNLFYVIVRGRVEVLKQLELGKHKRIAILEDGDYFGEIALIKATQRVVSVRALSPTVCVAISRKDFIKLVSKNPELKSRITEKIKARLGLTQDLN